MVDHDTDNESSIEDILASIRNIINKEEEYLKPDQEPDQDVKDSYLKISKETDQKREENDFSDHPSQKVKSESLKPEQKIKEKNQNQLDKKNELDKKQDKKQTKKNIVKKQKVNSETQKPDQETIKAETEKKQIQDKKELAESLEALFSPLNVEEEIKKEDLKQTSKSVKKKVTPKLNVSVSSVEKTDNNQQSDHKMLSDHLDKDSITEQKNQDFFVVKPEIISEPVINKQEFLETNQFKDIQFSNSSEQKESEPKHQDSQLAETQEIEKKIPPSIHMSDEELTHYIETQINQKISERIEKEVRDSIKTILIKTLNELSD